MLLRLKASTASGRVDIQMKNFIYKTSKWIGFIGVFAMLWAIGLYNENAISYMTLWAKMIKWIAIIIVSFIAHDLTEPEIEID